MNHVEISGGTFDLDWEAFRGHWTIQMNLVVADVDHEHDDLFVTLDSE